MYLFNLLSITISRNVIFSTLRISLLSILSSNLTISFILNNKILVLSIFNDNLLMFGIKKHIYICNMVTTYIIVYRYV